MNPQIHSEEQLALTHREAAFIETEVLVQLGFTSDEIISLLLLRQWYQNAGSDEEGLAAVQASYGPNYERLVRIKNTYDPTNFFHINQDIKPTREK